MSKRGFKPLATTGKIIKWIAQKINHPINLSDEEVGAIGLIGIGGTAATALSLGAHKDHLSGMDNRLKTIFEHLQFIDHDSELNFKRHIQHLIRNTRDLIAQNLELLKTKKNRGQMNEYILTLNSILQGMENTIQRDPIHQFKTTDPIIQTFIRTLDSAVSLASQ